ncbi:MAG TPA: spore coat U domain-containing protein [Sphingomonas sp.]
MRRHPAARATFGGVGLARAAAICCAIGNGAAAGAAPSASFQATATIVSGCEVDGALPGGGQTIGQIGTLDFGVHSALSTDTITASLAQNAGLLLVCTPGVALTMNVDAGLHGGATRAMQAPGNASRLSYHLYRDAAFAQELLANQPIPVSFVSATPIALPIFGRLTLPGNLPPGTYGDTVLVTLNW